MTEHIAKLVMNFLIVFLFLLAAWGCWFFGSTTNPVCGKDVGYEKDAQLGLMIIALQTV